MKTITIVILLFIVNLSFGQQNPKVTPPFQKLQGRILIDGVLGNDLLMHRSTHSDLFPRDSRRVFTNTTDPNDKLFWGGRNVHLNEALVPLAVDWLMIIIRPSTWRFSETTWMPCIVDQNGNWLDAETGSNILEANFPDGRYYIEVRHPNCISVASNLESFSRATTTNQDFTLGLYKYYLGAGGVNVNGLWCVRSGDVAPDNIVDGSDAKLVKNYINNNNMGYHIVDCAKDDGVIDGSEMSLLDNNAGKFSNVPPFN